MAVSVGIRGIDCTLQSPRKGEYGKKERRLFGLALCALSRPRMDGRVHQTVRRDRCRRRRRPSPQKVGLCPAAAAAADDEERTKRGRKWRMLAPARACSRPPTQTTPTLSPSGHRPRATSPVDGRAGGRPAGRCCAFVLTPSGATRRSAIIARRS